MEIDLNWLQYVANPFALVAAIAMIAGFSFRAAIGKMQKPKSGFILAMYAMFLLTILMLGLGAIGIYFLLSGPTDEVAKIKFEIFPTAAAQNFPPENLKTEKKFPPKNLKKSEKIDEKKSENENFSNTFLLKKPAKTGWIWAGEIEKIREKKFRAVNFSAPQKFIPEKNFEKIKFARDPKITFTKRKANLRAAPPNFSWWRLSYELGELLEVLPREQRIRILESEKFGQQLWIRAEVLPQIDEKILEKNHDKK